MRCFAHGSASSFNLKKLQEKLGQTYIIEKFDNIIHFQFSHSEVAHTEGNVFIFEYGAWIAWGLTSSLEQGLSELLQPFYQQKSREADDDVYSYDYAESATIADDHITLPSHDIKFKLAFSYGLAQSVKLGSFENTIQHTIELTKAIPENLSSSGTIPLSRKDIRRMMGRLFIDRHSINLWLEFLDLPDFFWENTALEHIHESVANYMDNDSRIKILNQRLEIMQELFDMLGSELNHQHSSRLEWIIIILILIEVVITLSKEIFHIL